MSFPFPRKISGAQRLAAIGVLLVARAVLAQSGAASPVDADAVVRHGVANHFAEEAAHQPLRFILHRRDTSHDLTRAVIETRQGDVALLIGVNGKPLDSEARQAQIARLNNIAADPALQAHRRKREREDAARVDKIMRLLPNAFLYRYVDTQPCNVSRVPDVLIPGAPTLAAASPEELPDLCYHMTFRPNPAFDPPDTESRILSGMAGDILMEKSQERLYRLNAHLVSDVDFGWGIVGRLNKGGTIYLEQDDIGGGDWELTRMRLNLTGKILLVKALTVRLSEETGHFSRVPPNLDYREAIRMLETDPRFDR